MQVRRATCGQIVRLGWCKGGSWESVEDCYSCRFNMKEKQNETHLKEVGRAEQPGELLFKKSLVFLSACSPTSLHVIILFLLCCMHHPCEAQ